MDGIKICDLRDSKFPTEDDPTSDVGWTVGLVEKLEEDNPNERYRSRIGNTAMHFAVRFSTVERDGQVVFNPDLLAVVLRLGGDKILGATNDHGSHPIHHAAAYNHSDALNWLLEQGVHPKDTAKDNMGNTVLHVACLAQAMGTLDILLNQAYGENKKDAAAALQDDLNACGLSAFQYAVNANHPELLEMLLEYISANGELNARSQLAMKR